MIRKNFSMVYEIFDELIDFGHLQLTNIFLIKPLIASEVIEPKSVLDVKKLGSFELFSSHSLLVLLFVRTSKISYLWMCIKISTAFQLQWVVINSSIDGFIQMKSYLLWNSSLKMILNEDLAMAKVV